MYEDAETGAVNELISLEEFFALSHMATPLREITLFVRRSRWYLGSQSVPLDFMVCSHLDGEGADLSVVYVIVKGGDGGVWNLPIVVTYERSDATPIAEVPRSGSSPYFIYDATTLKAGQKALVGDAALSKVEINVPPTSFEQSNTSFIYNDLYFKLYRRLVPHKNREVKLLEALSQVVEGDVPRVVEVGQRCGYSTHLILESLDGVDLYRTIKALLTSGDADGVDRVNKYLSNLGALLARLHRSLKDLFGYESVPTDQIYLRAYKRVSERITALQSAPSGVGYDTSQLEAVVTALSEFIKRSPLRNDPTKGGGIANTHIQVIHGDLHLGQVLLCGDRQVVIDFEGEVLGEVDDWFKAKEYDLAGVARSIHYASFESGYLLANGGEMVVSKLEDTFLAAYLNHQNTYDDSPVTAFDRDLYEILKIEKAVYELEYEVRAKRGLIAIPASFLLGKRGE